MPSPGYFVVCPVKIYPNSVYFITISVSNAEKPTNVDIQISSAAQKEFSVSTQDTLEKNESKIIQIQVGDWSGKECTLQIKANGGISFDHEANLALQTKSTIKTYIQMDKPMYKPSDVVKFRSVSINDDLLPVPGLRVSTLIKDPDGNVMKTFANVTPENSIVSNEFTLSDQPVLGDWELVIAANSNTTTKSFSVAEYVLPSFDVEITTPSVICVKDAKIPVAVNAIYTYGKPVTGQLELKVSGAKYWGSAEETLYEVKSEIKGKMDIELDMKSLIKEENVYDEKQFNIEATVKDDLSGKTYSKSKSMCVYQNPYKMTLIQKTQKYIPGSEYAFFVKVLYQDGTPIENNGPPLKVQLTTNTGKQDEVESVPVDGIARFSFSTSSFGNNAISLTGVYKQYESSLGYVAPVDTKGFIQVQDQTEEPERHYTVGETATIRIDSSHAMKDLFYEIVHRKGVVSNHVKVNEAKQHLLSLPITKAMAPKSKLIFHTIGQSDIQVDELTLLVSYDFKNDVSAKFSSGAVNPGKTVAIEIQSQPRSTVGLLAMDQQLVLLKTGNDFDRQSIIRDVENQVDFIANDSRYFAIYNPICSAFRDAGLLVFTNLIEDIYPTCRRAKALTFGSSSLFSLRSMPAMAAPIAYNSVVKTAVCLESQTIELDMLAEPSVKQQKPAIRLRKDFPETWIWNTVDTDASGHHELEAVVPDTITSWILSSFSVNSTTGFAIGSKDTLKVFRPFFVKLNLPYSIVRGETVTVKVTVYNYLNYACEAKLTLDTSKEDFTVDQASVNMKKEAAAVVMVVNVSANDGATIEFKITPNKVGYIDIKIRAESSTAGDEILQKLLVKPEGETRFFNKPALIALTPENPSFEDTVEIDIPVGFVPDSERIWVSVVGDILGSAINNLDKLLQMPYGCGEQNMINFVPNIIVLDYLISAGKLTAEIKSKALKHIENGYQRELTYKHNDGSYSAFGQSDRSGNTWLTAFVIKSFVQAQKYYEISEKIIGEGLTFLASKWSSDGTFKEHGSMFDKQMQGGAAANAGCLTAYVFVCLNMNASMKQYLDDGKRRTTLEYLEKRLQVSNDVYEVSIITYALSLSASKAAGSGLLKLTTLLTKTAAHVFCSSTSDESSIEATAYALMSYTIAGKINEALPMLRWLVSKQNANGGFKSTQDTIIGLEALGSFASKVSTSAPQIKMTLKADAATNENALEVNEDNRIVFQATLLSSKTRRVDLRATGLGSCIAQVSWQYNVMKQTEAPAFDVKYQDLKQNKDGSIRFLVSISYARKGQSGMAVMEVTFPSGFVADQESFGSMRSKLVKRVEAKDSGTVAVVYLEKNPYKMTLIQKTQKYIPGSEYAFFVKVLYQDGTPIENNGPPLKVQLTTNTGKQDEVESVPVDGIARFSFSTSSFGNNAISLTGVYKQYESSLGYVAPVDTKGFIQVQDQTEEPERHYTVGETATIRIDSSHAMKDLFYEIVHRKGVVSNHVKVNEAKQHLLSLPITKAMAPKSKLIFHTIGQSDIQVDELTLLVSYDFKNDVSAKFSSGAVNPGKTVAIEIQSQPRSTVGLLAMDQQLVLLKTGNDFDRQSIIRDVENQVDFIANDSRYFAIYNPICSAFRDAGLLVFTNLIEDIYPTCRRAKALTFGSSSLFSLRSMPAMAAPIAYNSVVKTAVCLESQTIELDMLAEPSVKQQKPAIRLRKDFPETWIWNTVDTDASGHHELEAVVPDTITSWILSSFSVNSTTGFAIGSKDTLKVFRPFFVKLNLPYSIVRGETVTVKVTVYNYLNYACEAKLTLDTSKEDFTVDQASVNMKKEAAAVVMVVNVSANDGATIEFKITPNKVGYIDIKIRAESSTAGDEILQKLLVKPEGETRFFNKPALIALTPENPSFEDTVEIDIPVGFVPDSERIWVSVVGDILGSAINNLDKLLQMPYGCGEQNMINFVPNIIVLDYLISAGKLTAEIKSKALKHIENGYQRELTYKHNDGSYSAFGQSDRSGNTWLTAFVIKSFVQAQKYYEISEKIIGEGLTFLASKWSSDGTFKEHGSMFDKQMQGGAAANAGCLTAYVFVCLNMNASMKQYLDDGKRRTTLEYLEKRLQVSNDVYEVSIITYALSLSASKAAGSGLLKLTTLLTKTAAHVFCSSTSDESSIEATAYALMSYTIAGKINEALPMLRWLVSKQNANGGFKSTQDTIIGLEALGSFASKVSTSAPQIKMTLKADAATNENALEVNEDNRIVFQATLLSSKTRRVDLRATGLGSCIAQVSWQYNVMKQTEAPAFDVKYQDLKQNKDGSIRFLVSISYARKGQSGMAVMEVTFPSGFVADQESFGSMRSKLVKRVEAKDSGTVAVVYLEKVTSEVITVPVCASKVAQVDGLKPAPITIYDYYDKAKTATMFYQLN